MSPSDDAKLQALTEGLEISILPLSSVIADNRVLRFDSTYFKRASLLAEALIKAGTHETVKKVASQVESFGAYSLTNQFEYQEDGIPFLRCLNIVDSFVNFGNVLYISDDAHKILWKSEVKPGMVLLTMSGSVGNTAVALHDWPYPINSNQDIAKITPGNIDPFYLSVFLSCKYGRSQIERMPVGSVQQHIFLWMIERMLVSRFSHTFELRVSQLAQRAYSLHINGTKGIEEAENILVVALGLAKWKPAKPNSYICSIGDVFSAKRLDAEYFTPRTRELIERLSADKLTIGDIATPRRERFSKKDCDTFNYIEIGDLKMDGSASSSAIEGAEAPSRATWHVRAGDVITSTVRPIRQLSALIEPSQDGFVCSSGFAVLSPKEVRPEVLLTYLRLPLICELMDLYTSASMYPAISERDILALPFKRIDEKSSLEICEAVAQAQETRLRTQSLLNNAKCAIEIAIEDSEAAALRFLNKAEV